jgi:glucoamylase
MTANTAGGRSGIDANTALASIHTFDPAAGCDAVTFQPCSDKALSSLLVYVDSFRSIYTINNGTPPNSAVATGRYPEDVYQGGNVSFLHSWLPVSSIIINLQPWYLTTFAVAEQLYDALIVWGRQGSLTITDLSLPFFQQFGTVSPGTYPSSSSTFTNLTSSIRTFADGFLAINANYTPSNGGLAEQFSKNDGVPLSALDLTWSYASALTAFAARNGTVPASWGASGLSVPSVCQSYSGPLVAVTFNVLAYTDWGGECSTAQH